MHDFAATVIADRYTLEQELGRGGMATVWRAHDRRHDRLVAIKILHPELAGFLGTERFVREVQLTAKLQHPGIVPVLDSGVFPVAGGTPLPWYAMTYLPGESLRARLARDHQLPIGEALQITAAVADALQQAHRQGILHRDIKPENILLAEGRTWVVDFGIAKAVLDIGGERLTSTGLSVGTPAYMSPEQTSGGEIDARSDQYSLAVTLYEMLSGEPPFTGTTQAIMARRFTEPARPLRTVRSTVPEHVERAVLRALERVPADRFPDLAAFTAALRSPATPGPPPASRPAPAGSHRAAAITVGLVAVAALAGWFYFRTPAAAAGLATDPAIVALYQRGLRGYNRRTPSGNLEAISAFSGAVARDSAYLPAWTGLARSYVQAYGRGFAVGALPRDSVLQRAIAAADRALAIDTASPDAWLTQAVVGRHVDPTDVGPTLRSVRQAVRLDSSSAVAWHTLAVALTDMGDLAGGTEAWRSCVHWRPTDTQCLSFLALAHYWHRQYDSATTWADSAIALDPNYLLGRTTIGFIALQRDDFPRAAAAFRAAERISTAVEALNALAGRALTEARAGRTAEARVILGRADSLAAGYVPVPQHTLVYLAQAHAALGEADRAMAWLRQYEPPQDLHFQLHLRCDPPFDPLRGDSRFRSLLTLPAPPPGKGC